MQNKLPISIAAAMSITLISACDSGRDRAESLRQEAGEKAEEIRDVTKDKAEALKERAESIEDRGEKKAELTEEQADMQTRSRSGADVAGLQSDQIERYQQQLKNLGFLKGNVDGIVGPQTRAAVRDFQSKENMDSTGQLDSETRSRLSQQAGTVED